MMAWIGKHLLSHEAINKCSSVHFVSRWPQVYREPLVALWEIPLAIAALESGVDHSVVLVFFLSHSHLDAQGAFIM